MTCNDPNWMEGPDVGSPDEEQPTAAQYKALLSAFAKQEWTMKRAAMQLRLIWSFFAGEHIRDTSSRDKAWSAHLRALQLTADLLAPREPIAEADAVHSESIGGG
jgi:hypothetical protein